MGNTLRIFRSTDMQWRAVLIDDKGQILLTEEGWDSPEDCEQAIELRLNRTGLTFERAFFENPIMDADLNQSICAHCKEAISGKFKPGPVREVGAGHQSRVYHADRPACAAAADQFNLPSQS